MGVLSFDTYLGIDCIVDCPIPHKDIRAVRLKCGDRRYVVAIVSEQSQVS